MSKGKNAIRNSLVGLGGQLITMLVQFLSRSIFINYLGVELLGLNSTFGSLLNTLSLAELGFQMAIVYRLYKPLNSNDIEQVNEVVNIFRIVYRCIGIFFLVASVACIPLLKYLITGIEITVPVCIFFLLQSIQAACTYFLAYKRSLLYADQKEYLYKIIDIVFLVVFTVIKVVAVILYRNFYLYLIIQIIQTYGSNIIVHFMCKKTYPYLKSKKINKELFKAIWKDVKDVFASRIAGYIYSSTDNLVLSSLVSTIMVGYLVNYTTITANIRMLLQSILSPITPIIGNILASNEEKGSSEIVFNIYTRVRHLFACVILVPMTVLIQDFISLWIGKQYQLPILIVWLLVIDLYIHIVHSATCDYIIGAGLFKQDKKIEMCGAAMNIIFSVSLTFGFGLFGIKLATVIVQIYYWIRRSTLVYNRCFDDTTHKKLFQYWKQNGFDFIVFLVCYCLTEMIYIRLPMQTLLLKFIIGGVLSVSISFILFMIFNWKNIYVAKMRAFAFSKLIHLHK